MYAGGLVYDVLEGRGVSVLRLRRIAFGVTAVAAALMGGSFTLAAFPNKIAIKVAFFFVPIQARKQRISIRDRMKIVGC